MAAQKIGLKAGRPSSSQPTVSLSDLKPGTVRLNVDIEKDLHKRLKIHAVESDKTVSDIVRELIVLGLGSFKE